MDCPMGVGAALVWSAGGDGGGDGGLPAGVGTTVMVVVLPRLAVGGGVRLAVVITVLTFLLVSVYLAIAFLSLLSYIRTRSCIPSKSSHENFHSNPGISSLLTTVPGWDNGCPGWNLFKNLKLFPHSKTISASSLVKNPGTWDLSKIYLNSFLSLPRSSTSPSQATLTKNPFRVSHSPSNPMPRVSRSPIHCSTTSSHARETLRTSSMRMGRSQLPPPVNCCCWMILNNFERSFASSLTPLTSRMMRKKDCKISAGSRKSDSRWMILVIEEAGIERRVCSAVRTVVVHSARATRVGIGESSL